MPHQFDDDVRRALKKWPDVPACYGWLGLDRRGNWLIKGAKISHRRAIEFLSRNYARDRAGCFFVQNGPQRAYCDLAYTPWIYCLDGSDRLITHTAQPVVNVIAVVVDETGNVLLETEYGIGLVHDRDLERFIALLESAGNNRVKYGDLAAYLCGLEIVNAEPITLEFGDATLPVRSVSSARVAEFYRFEANPSARG